MTRREKLSFFLLAAGAAATVTCGGSPSGYGWHAPLTATTRATAPAPKAHALRTRFTVAIVVDQHPAWVAASRWPELPSNGGFARLRREGTWVKNMRYPYAVTDTAPGHAALHTGKVPAESGVVGNELVSPDGRRFTLLRDDRTRTVTPRGVLASPGSSAALLRADTVADRLRAAHPEALVVSVSLKDRAAILPAGKHPTHALWFDPDLDTFVTSTAFEPVFPSWATAIADRRAVATARSKPWRLDDRAWVAEHSAGPDDQAGEGDLDGLGVVFPHVARTAAAFRALPASDGMIVDLALAALDAEYDPSKPTLLLLSMSASDVIGHVFGPDSWEAWDQLRKLDARLGALIETLDRRAGAPVSVLVASDHGDLSMPEIAPARAGVRCPDDPYGRPCTTGVRIEPAVLERELVAATTAALGRGDWIAGIADPYVFLTPAARALDAKRRETLDAVIRATLSDTHHEAIESVLDARMLAKRCPGVLESALAVPARALGGEDVLPLVCRAWGPFAGAGDYYLVPRAGAGFDGQIVIGKGASHGSPHLYDRTVPMLVRAPGVIDAGAIVEAPVDFSVFAALEASFAGVDPRAPRDILASDVAEPRARPHD